MPLGGFKTELGGFKTELGGFEGGLGGCRFSAGQARELNSERGFEATVCCRVGEVWRGSAHGRLVLVCGTDRLSGMYSFAPMDAAIAVEIADTWKYPPPHDLYDMTADPDDYAEFVDPTQWPAHFFKVLSEGASPWMLLHSTHAPCGFTSEWDSTSFAATHRQRTAQSSISSRWSIPSLPPSDLGLCTQPGTH